MRVPAVVERYCLSICSGDFNEWVLKNATTESPYSYLFTGEYEMPEWDLGHTVNGTKQSMPVSLNLEQFQGFNLATLISEASEPKTQVRAQSLERPSQWRHEMPAQGGFILRLDK